MGSRLQAARLPAAVNPGGILFNPLSISYFLTLALTDTCPDYRYVAHTGQWASIHLHSRCSHPDRDAAIALATTALRETAAALDQAQVLMLTWGTAFVWRDLATGAVAANCHKLPAAGFRREMLTAEALIADTRDLIQRLRDVYPGLRILLTVSPVRHTRDTLPLNAVSKATLRLAAHRLCETEPDTYAYFPAWEILMDDLRDYRYYEADMIHPSPVAEQYIWEKFVAAHLRPDAQALLDTWEDISRTLAHRPRQTDSPAHRQTLLRLLDRLQAVRHLIPCEAEIEVVEQWVAAV
jgi:hypothetical protein